MFCVKDTGADLNWAKPINNRMSQKVKIAFIVNDTDFFLSHRLSLAQACQDHFDVVALLPHSNKNELIKELGIPVREYSLQKNGTNPFYELFTLWTLFFALKAEKPDLVHSFTIKPALYGTLIGRLLRIERLFVTITGLGFIYVNRGAKSGILRPVINQLYRIILRSPHVRVIFQNADDQKIFLENGWTTDMQSKVIPGSGVDPKKFYPIEKTSNDDNFPIVVPCRMLWDKGVQDIVQAFLILDLPSPRFQLLLAGRSAEDNPAGIPETQLRAWEKMGAIRWLGHTKDMNALYNQAEVVCLPSHREGLPLALLEASLCQKAILTTDAPGCRALIRDRVNGLLVPPQDPQSLAMALKRLIDNPELRLQLGTRAREIAQTHYTAPIINQQVIGFYKFNDKLSKS